MNEGRHGWNAKEANSDDDHAGGAPVVVCDRESLLHEAGMGRSCGEGEQFKLFGVSD
ncbi:hypothetical protein [Polycladidibacter hongkongensis]|uniref:hypothetical protein n=1 Tax=Polycladidibacter hongkongensis TaxID=1647556 RepID=UPI0012E37FDD|nr:hypothetical protein [Pseudovibrio hongkongensis]